MIRYFADTKTFALETKGSSYVLGLNDRGVPMHVYYGSHLRCPEQLTLRQTEDNDRFVSSLKLYEYPQEYVTRCRGVYDEESLMLRFFDGVCDVELVYREHEIEEDRLVLTLVDPVYALEVRLCYRVLWEQDMIERWAEIGCKGRPVSVENAASASVYLPNGRYAVTSYAGSQKREYTPTRTPLPEGKLVFDTRRGVSSGPHHVPFFTVTDAEQPAVEQAGELYFFALRYAGNFKAVFEKNHAGTVKITAGVNFFDTVLTLQDGESFTTPALLMGYFDGGYAKMREHLYDLEYDLLASQQNIKRPFPIIYNSWYPYRFDINEEKLMSLVDRVKEIGAELLVVDDGWMPNRTSDLQGLGDWYADPVRFPNGLAHIARTVRENGLLFGLWIEPEMVTEDAALYREHPEWVLKYPTREPSKMRNQLVLNLAREDVYDFVEKTVDRLIESCELDYLKWDMNRYIAETDRTADFYIRYTANMTRLYRHIREKYPALLIENCAHGGARADLGLFAYCDRINRSDNSDPIDVLRLHENFTDMFPPRYAGGAGNVSISPNTTNGRSSPLAYRAMLGMTGSMSIGFDILRADGQELAQIKEFIAYYKGIRRILHDAYLYKISSANGSKVAIWQYTARSRCEAVVFIFAHGLHYGEGMRRIRLQGLRPEGIYTVNGMRYAGDTLMKYGLDIEMPKGDYYSRIIEIKEGSKE